MINKSFEQVMMMISSADPAERALGMRYIGKHRYRTATDVCMLSLHDDDADVRAWAAWALDRIGDPSTISALVDALEDDEFGVRSNAGWGLVHIARRFIPHMVLPEVIDLLKESDNNETRQMAYLVLHHIGGADARQAIAQYWQT